ncbi:MAG: hypothetical protein BWK74_02865 [Desulfobacteraceae bacterium A6]|nr:MAG: hypothetical protein BWK74_02865 [Desulfobacteraceae bacterium A6]
MAILLLLVKPAVIRTENETRLAVLFRWQTGTISFINSVTGQPVVIRFTIRSQFQNFSVSADETTEAYYSHGVYNLNQAVSCESTSHLKFCSMKGIMITMGFYTFTVKDGCLEVDLLWTL